MRQLRPRSGCRRCAPARTARPAAGVGLCAAIAWCALALGAPADVAGQGAGGVRTNERDVTVVLGGELVLDAVVQSSFFRQANDSHGWELLAAHLRIDFDVRFTADFGLYAAIQTRQRDTIPEFGSAMPRSVGYVLGESNPEVEIGELFVDANRLLGIDWSLRAGLAHFQLGLDTTYEDSSGYSIWDGHGRLFMDTFHGRGRYTDRMRPVGVHAAYDFGNSLTVLGYAAWMSRDLSDDAADVWLAAVEGHWHETNLLEVVGGYARLFDNAGPNLDTVWAGARFHVDQFLSFYGEAAFQFGNDQSGSAAYGGVRYLFDQGRSLLDVSFWVLSGDDTATLAQQEGFQSFGSLNTLMIVESLNYGLGRQSNYSALKAVLSIPLRYDLRLRVVYGRFNAERSADSPRPGDEANIFLTYFPSQLIQLEAGFGFLYTSNIYGDDAPGEGWMAIVRIRADF